MIEILCDSCANAEIKVVEIQKPLYANARETHTVKHLSIWCKDSCSFKQRCITYKNHTCDYKPKSGKIGKRLFQKTLF